MPGLVLLLDAPIGQYMCPGFEMTCLASPHDELNWWACSTLSNVLQSAALRLLLLSKPCFWRESMRGARINVGGPTGGL